ncbi:hypothetical protein Tco_0323871 [Tanacetum coccineum]
MSLNRKTDEKSGRLARGFEVSIVGGGVGVASIGVGVKKLVLNEEWVPEFLGLHGEQEHPMGKLFLHQYEEYLKNLGILMLSQMSEKSW